MPFTSARLFIPFLPACPPFKTNVCTVAVVYDIKPTSIGIQLRKTEDLVGVRISTKQKNLPFWDGRFYLRDLGLKASFNPSPMKLIERIVVVMIKAGGIQIHGLPFRTSGSFAEDSIFPQLGTSCGTPKPR